MLYGTLHLAGGGLGISPLRACWSGRRSREFPAGASPQRLPIRGCRTFTPRTLDLMNQEAGRPRHFRGTRRLEVIRR
jgi:hypothetical protein